MDIGECDDVLLSRLDVVVFGVLDLILLDVTFMCRTLHYSVFWIV